MTRGTSEQAPFSFCSSYTHFDIKFLEKLEAYARTRTTTHAHSHTHTHTWRT